MEQLLAHAAGGGSPIPAPLAIGFVTVVALLVILAVVLKIRRK